MSFEGKLKKVRDAALYQRAAQDYNVKDFVKCVEEFVYLPETGKKYAATVLGPFFDNFNSNIQDALVDMEGTIEKAKAKYIWIYKILKPSWNVKWVEWKEEQKEAVARGHIVNRIEQYPNEDRAHINALFEAMKIEYGHIRAKKLKTGIIHRIASNVKDEILRSGMIESQIKPLVEHEEITEERGGMGPIKMAVRNAVNKMINERKSAGFAKSTEDYSGIIQEIRDYVVAVIQEEKKELAKKKRVA